MKEVACCDKQDRHMQELSESNDNKEVVKVLLLIETMSELAFEEVNEAMQQSIDPTKDGTLYGNIVTIEEASHWNGKQDVEE